MIPTYEQYEISFQDSASSGRNELKVAVLDQTVRSVLSSRGLQTM